MITIGNMHPPRRKLFLYPGEEVKPAASPG